MNDRQVNSRTRLKLAVAGAIGAGIMAVWLLGGDSATPPEYDTATVEKGSIREVVSATGTLSALITVEVGSQLSGQISELFVDFNSDVKEGDVIALLDPATFETRVAQAEAELAIANANVTQATASQIEAQAVYDEAARSLDRNRNLRERGNVSEAQLETAIATMDQAKARLMSATAQVDTAVAQVKQREASLRSARVDLERTQIRSPVDGVVIDRSIDVGQTVAASLQAPILFTIAKDLREMQLEVSVDEADIGKVRAGQPVSFTVDAYPMRQFAGSVEQVRKAPTVEQNVVTYTVIVSALNTEQILLPGMTANVEIVVDARDGVLIVPNQAFRFSPENAQELIADKYPPADAATGQKQYVWRIKGDSGFEPVPVLPGINDGFRSEITAADLQAGDTIALPALKRAGGQSGFGPRAPGRF